MNSFSFDSIFCSISSGECLLWVPLIVAQIRAKRHPGCWTTDISSKFRDLPFLEILVNYEEDNYETVLIFNWVKEKLELIPDVLVELSKHP